MKKSSEIIPPTIFERFIGLTRLPYTTSCILITLVLGTPGTLLARYLDSFDFIKTIYIPGFVIGSEGYWRAVAFYWILTYVFFLLYLYYFVRYFRLKTVDALVALSPLLKGDKSKMSRDFQIVHSKYGILITTAIIGMSFAPSVNRMIGDSLGPISSAQVVISQAVLDFGAGTGIWLFFSSIWSLRRLSRQSMELKTFSEDPLFGLGPIGSISLALVIIYFGALGLRGFGIFVSGVEYTPSLFNLIFELILILSGLALFYSTIHTFHIKMVEQKKIETKKIMQQIMTLTDDSIKEKLPRNGSNLDYMKGILISDIIKRRIEKMRTWPFDTGVLDRILVILISVISIIVARITISVLHL